MERTPVAPSRPLTATLIVTLGMIVTVASALGFQHLGGYVPCALCLVQRDPYYFAIPLGILAIAFIAFHLPLWTVRVLLAIIGVVMLIGAGIAVYHAGVEWHFWAGPATCATSAPSVTTSAGNLLGDLDAVKPPSCSDASLRVLGLSFAGWNVLASLALAAVAFWGVSKGQG
ncbi:disulfide bond formation protein B [Rhizobium sp. CFBP 8762]|uniref:disulfide bond formation protein B n=1 Tax=Rhizobium sp. CFBP 8762 TaxID=2775279 RepID=UPI00177DF981|nr:disulfide bond formation protein B [Rhizobium sp. CFBP 8762]MBD8556966.1 disulfide bond formation protein B [Rhizobium sp. CFBP 8762]